MTTTTKHPELPDTGFRLEVFSLVLCLAAIAAGGVVHGLTMREDRHLRDARYAMTVESMKKVHHQTQALATNLGLSSDAQAIFDEYTECLGNSDMRAIRQDKHFTCSAAAQFKVKETAPNQSQAFDTLLTNYRMVYTTENDLLNQKLAARQKEKEDPTRMLLRWLAP